MSAGIVQVIETVRESAWLPWAVQYFFLIGLSVGAFALSLPGIALRLPQWRAISQRALLVALLCGLTAPVALLADLHQPGRFLNFYLHPNVTSWMSWGSFFIPLYLASLVLYAWLAVRPALASRAAEGGRAARWYVRLAYGGHESRGALAAAVALAAIGAALVLVYTGMEIVVLEARPLWSTPLLPPVLFLTALAGAAGLVHLLHRASGDAAREGARRLNAVIVATQTLVLLAAAAWLATAFSGASASHAAALAQIIDTPALVGYAAWALAATLAALILAATKPHSGLLVGLIALHSAWMARWTLLMGGQGLSKLGEDYRAYELALGFDGVLGIVGTAGLWIFLYVVLTALLPWGEQSTGLTGAQS